MAFKVHYSQRTPHERKAAREAHTKHAGINNRDGGQSYFTQGHGDAAPTVEEIAESVQWQRGTETAGHVSHSYGPDFSKVLADVPANEESASRHLHTGKRNG